MINVVEVKTKKQQKLFVDFPTKLYSGNDYYVPPLRGDELNLFNPKKNVSYDECEIVFYLAYKDGNVAGRICAIVQKVYNAKTNSKNVRFSRFDCIEDFEVAKALIEKVEQWAKMQGMNVVHGPLGFHDLDREGLLVEGYDKLATFEENYNFPYYKDYLEKLGYQKDDDYLAFRIKLPKETDPRVKRISEMVLKKYDLRIATAKNKRAYIKKYKDQIFDLIDDAYGDLYGVISLNQKLRKQIIDQFNLIIKLKYIISVVDKDDRIVAFGFALPSMAEAVRSCHGRLTLSGICKILHATNHAKVADFGLVGVRREYQNKGVMAVILQYIVEGAKDVGIEEIETNHSLEDNYKIIQTWKNFPDKVQHKRFRCFIKHLDKPETKKNSSKKTTTKKKSASTKTASKTPSKKALGKSENKTSASKKPTAKKQTTTKVSPSKKSTTANKNQGTKSKKSDN